MTKKQITNIKQVENPTLIPKSQHPEIFNISKLKTKKRPCTSKAKKIGIEFDNF